jgi:hypothetical protein
MGISLKDMPRPFCCFIQGVETDHQRVASSRRTDGGSWDAVEPRNVPLLPGRFLSFSSYRLFERLAGPAA